MFKKIKQKSPFCYQKYSENIIMYEKDYLKLQSELPLHGIEKMSRYVIISLLCPFAYRNRNIKFYEFGNLLEFDKNNEIVIHKDRYLFISSKKGNTPSIEYNPCNLCKNELNCIFSSKIMKFQPKEYNIVEFVKKLEILGMSSSTEMYERFIKDTDGHIAYDDMSELEIFVILFSIIPVILFYSPFHFLGLKLKQIISRIKKRENMKP